MNLGSTWGWVGARLDIMEDKTKYSLYTRWLRSRHRSIYAFLHKVQEEVDAKDERIQELREELDATRNEADGMVLEHRRLIEWGEEAGKFNRDLRAEIKDLEERLEVQKGIQDKLRVEMYRKDSEIRVQQRDLHDQNVRLELKTGKIKDLENQVGVLKDQARRQQGVIAALRANGNLSAEYQGRTLDLIASIARDETESIVDRLVRIQNCTEDYTK